MHAGAHFPPPLLPPTRNIRCILRIHVQSRTIAGDDSVQRTSTRRQWHFYHIAFVGNKRNMYSSIRLRCVATVVGVVCVLVVVVVASAVASAFITIIRSPCTMISFSSLPHSCCMHGKSAHLQSYQAESSGAFILFG